MDRQKNNKRAILGLILVIVGFLLVASNFHLFPFPWRHVIFSWQGILILIGIFFLFSREATATGWILIGIGGFFLIPRIWEVPGGWNGLFWPAILLGVGAILIVRGLTQRRHNVEDSVDFIDDMNIFGGGDRIINSQNFKGGRMTFIFGGSKYNMMSAELAKGRNTIDLFAMFGGCKFLIPPDWIVRLEVNGIFGGFSDKRAVRKDLPRDPSKELVIKGVCIFGGGDVVSF